MRLHVSTFKGNYCKQVNVRTGEDNKAYRSVRDKPNEHNTLGLQLTVNRIL